MTQLYTTPTVAVCGHVDVKNGLIVTMVGEAVGRPVVGKLEGAREVGAAVGE